MKIVVLAGGLSTERAVSLVTGCGVCRALRERGHRAILVDLFLGVENAPSDLEALFDAPDGLCPQAEIETLTSTDEGVAFLVTLPDGRTVFHAGDLNWWHWEGEDKGWNRNMEANFKRYTQPLQGRRIDLAMLPLDPRLGEAGFWGPAYFLEKADIRRFLPMHQWGDFDFTRKFLEKHPAFTDLAAPVERTGQTFVF